MNDENMDCSCTAISNVKSVDERVNIPIATKVMRLQVSWISKSVITFSSTRPASLAK